MMVYCPYGGHWFDPKTVEYHRPAVQDKKGVWRATCRDCFCTVDSVGNRRDPQSRRQREAAAKIAVEGGDRDYEDDGRE